MLRIATSTKRDQIDAATLDDQVALVIESLYPRIFRFARFRLERADAEDAVAGALERMWTARTGYQPQRGPLEPWLHTVGLNAIRDECRRRYRRPDMVRLDDLDLPGPSPDLDLVTRMADVRRALAHLSASEAELIGYRYGMDLSHQAIAELTRQTPGAVATAVHRALRRLREEMSR